MKKSVNKSLEKFNSQVSKLLSNSLVINIIRGLLILYVALGLPKLHPNDLVILNNKVFLF